MNEETRQTALLPLLPLRGVTAFPGVLLSFEVERPMSVAALNAALGENQEIFLVTQSDVTAPMPRRQELYAVGTVCSVRQMLRIPGGNLVKVMVEGLYRARILSVREAAPYFSAEVAPLPTPATRLSAARREALIRHCLGQFQAFCELMGQPMPERFLRLLDSRETYFDLTLEYRGETLHGAMLDGIPLDIN